MCEGRLMRTFGAVCVAVLAFCACAGDGLGPAVAHAQNGAVKAIFEKYELLGFFAQNCSKPPNKDSNWYFVNRLVDADHVQRDFMESATSRQWFVIIDQASETGQGEISVSGTRDGKRYDGVWHVEKNRMLQWAINRGGEQTIANGRSVSTGKHVPWVNKCGK